MRSMFVANEFDKIFDQIFSSDKMWIVETSAHSQGARLVGKRTNRNGLSIAIVLKEDVSNMKDLLCGERKRSSLKLWTHLKRVEIETRNSNLEEIFDSVSSVGNGYVEPGTSLVFQVLHRVRKVNVALDGVCRGKTGQCDGSRKTVASFVFDGVIAENVDA